MDFGGGGGTPPLIDTRDLETVTPSSEDVARQAREIRRKRRGIKDLIIEPATATPQEPDAVNTGRYS